MPTPPIILENLARAQRELLRAADAVPAEQWTIPAEEGRWSAGEVVAHLISVERSILSGADKLLQHAPKKVPFYKRYRVPMVVVERRFLRRRTPIPVEEEQLREKEVMLAELREVRERTLAFIEETKGRDLSAYCRWHAPLGTLNVYEWFQMIASHEIRHTKQMKEISQRLPKVVASLQK